MAFFRVFSYFLTLVGTVVISNAIVGWYMVFSGLVQPGEPMFIDELSPSPREAYEAAAIGTLLVVFASFLRRLIAFHSGKEK